MADLQAELEALRRRLRLRTFFFFGALFVTAASLGGARAAVRVFTESDAWVLATREDPGSGTDKLSRLIVTGDTDVSRIRIEEANLHLAQQSSAPSSPNPGSLWYDSSVGRLKYRGASSWMDPGRDHRFVIKPSDESLSNSTTLQDDDHLKFPIGANEKWVAELWILGTYDGPGHQAKLAVSAPSGASIQYWGLFADSKPPSQGLDLWYAGSGGTGLRAQFESAINGYRIHVSVANGSTAGDVVFQWAQWTARQEAITVKAGSMLEATLIP